MAVNLTYRELKAMVPATPKGKMPRADKIKGEILFSEDVDGAIITVYKDGFLTYTVNTANTDNNSNNCVSNASNNVKKSRKSGNNISNGKGIKGSRGQKNSNGQENCGNKKNTVTVYDEPRTTVYSVHKCSQIVFMTGFSTDEYKEECGWCGEHSKVTYRVVEDPATHNRQLTRIVTVDEKAYQDYPWWLPIVVICDERLNHNDYVRFMSKIELMDGDDLNDEDNGEHHNPSEWLEAIAQTEEDERNHEILVDAMETLTDTQYKTVELYYKEGLSEREIAKVLNVKQQSVHDILKAAITRLRKKFF